MKILSVTVRQVRSSDEGRLIRWLGNQNRCHIRFSVSDLLDWISTHEGFVAEHPDGGLLGFFLYMEVTKATPLLSGSRWEPTATTQRSSQLCSSTPDRTCVSTG